MKRDKLEKLFRLIPPTFPGVADHQERAILSRLTTDLSQASISIIRSIKDDEDVCSKVLNHLWSGYVLAMMSYGQPMFPQEYLAGKVELPTAEEYIEFLDSVSSEDD